MGAQSVTGGSAHGLSWISRKFSLHTESHHGSGGGPPHPHLCGGYGGALKGSRSPTIRTANHSHSMGSGEWFLYNFAFRELIAELQQYPYDDRARGFIDFFQVKLRCCGVVSLNDYQRAVHWLYESFWS
ncbi:unnamed protein product [Oppiella nova]|uniref:Uncharacterized protein n=1 Tax=Oppiella nova TaxID=334625 RepID=A0A7R9QF79_9ACAR|nr:unnamed protein product [Oppiella nova]CAG2164634.1 unnamed protein product [Oppiella nova]